MACSSLTRRSGRRYYHPDQLHRLALIQLLQDTGLLSLDDIEALLAGVGPESVWREMMQRQLGEIDGRIAQLQNARAYLTHAVACPRQDPINECPVLRRQVEDLLATAGEDPARRGPPPGWRDAPVANAARRLERWGSGFRDRHFAASRACSWPCRTSPGNKGQLRVMPQAGYWVRHSWRSVSYRSVSGSSSSCFRGSSRTRSGDSEPGTTI